MARSGTDPQCTRAPTLKCGSLRRGPKGHWNESLCGPRNAIAHRLRANFCPPKQDRYRCQCNCAPDAWAPLQGPSGRATAFSKESAPGLLTVSHSGAGRAALRAAYSGPSLHAPCDNPHGADRPLLVLTPIRPQQCGGCCSVPSRCSYSCTPICVAGVSNE
jgi:hypothetical protein